MLTAFCFCADVGVLINSKTLLVKNANKGVNNLNCLILSLF